MERSNEGIGKGDSSVIVWISSRLQSIEKKNSGLGKSFFNPLHPRFSIHILHTALYTFPKVLTRRICLPIKSFFC